MATSSSAPSSQDDSRFLPGTVIAGRYRIFGLIGRGGMGEVYRADDLKLGQIVALKFLPTQADPSRRERFLNEVKITRQVSHPNVCRVYDVGDVDGHTFLSMEFIDGEDLASLLRRIGRLPEDKATEIARQLCAGLAAAHDQGVLHRDFKPANVMIDGRGRARITDFGLAALAGDVEGVEVRSGTPKYMAPEQLAGHEVTERSDLYALGLVLYELFTGKTPFDAETPADLLRLQSESTPASPTSHVAGLDPAIERAVLRCLEREPARRPASALTVAAALPGGDPLAAALAAGETPSPEMVADAGHEGALHPAFAVGLLLLALGGLLAGMMIQGRMSYLEADPPRRTTGALLDRASQMVRDLGYDAEPADSAFGVWGPDWNQREHLKQQASDRAAFVAALKQRPMSFRLWYRESPRPLIATDQNHQVGFGTPPPRLSGESLVVLDTEGRLQYFEHIPPQKHRPEATVPLEDWEAVFDMAGLDLADFHEVDPEWVPLRHCENRRAWQGSYPEQSEPTVTVHGCSFDGKPTYFEFNFPWSRAWRIDPWEPDVGDRLGAILSAIVVLGLLTGAVYLARRNLLMGRGDRKGALRYGVFIGGVQLAMWLVRSDHVAAVRQEMDKFILALAFSVFVGCVVWAMYLALEPFARRRWPQVLVSWNRLLSGRVRDPLVGNHVLIGACLAAVASLLGQLGQLAPVRLGLGPPELLWFNTEGLQGLRFVVGQFLGLVDAGFAALMFLFFLVVFRVMLRRPWAAVVATLLLFGLMQSLGNLGDESFWIILAVNLTRAGVTVFCLVRFGLLAAMAMMMLEGTSWRFALGSDFTAWYAEPSWLGFAMIAAMLAVAFYISLGGRSLIKAEALDG